jgi:thioredoxin 1
MSIPKPSILKPSILKPSRRRPSTLESVTDASFERDVLRADKTVVVDFWAEWCPPCHALSPVLERLAAEHPDALRIVKLNADDNPKTAAEYHAMALPTLHVFERGEVVKTIIGAKPYGVLEAALAPYLG